MSKLLRIFKDIAIYKAKLFKQRLLKKSRFLGYSIKLCEMQLNQKSLSQNYKEILTCEKLMAFLTPFNQDSTPKEN